MQNSATLIAHTGSDNVCRSAGDGSDVVDFIVPAGNEAYPVVIASLRLPLLVALN